MVHGIDIEVFQGEVLGLIGTNGAGKSTTMVMLLGILKPDGGQLAYWRSDFKNHIGVQLQSTPFFEGYSAAENIALFGALYKRKFSKKEIVKILELCKLEDSGRTIANKLSIGQQKRLSICLATVNNPQLIVLDEPTAGLDPIRRQEVRQLIKQLANKDTTIIFSSHDMEEVSKLANRIILLDEGKVILNDSPKGLLEKYKCANLEELYLNIKAITTMKEVI